MSRSLRQVATAGLSTLAFVVACGEGTAPDEWASRVCDALTPWRNQISALNVQAQQQMTTAAGPADARSHLLELVAGAEGASETARAAVEDAGTPDVDGGDEVARRFAATLAGARDAYAHARVDLQALPTHDATAFYDGVVAVMARLTEEYTTSGLDPSRLDSPELRRAFDGAAQCR